MLIHSPFTKIVEMSQMTELLYVMKAAFLEFHRLLAANLWMRGGWPACYIFGSEGVWPARGREGGFGILFNGSNPAGRPDACCG